MIEPRVEIYKNSPGGQIYNLLQEKNYTRKILPHSKIAAANRDSHGKPPTHLSNKQEAAIERHKQRLAKAQ